MREELIKFILDICYKEHKYKLNEDYSRENIKVFTKFDDKFHRLVFDKKSADKIEVRHTYDIGFITDRDMYTLKNSALVKIGSDTYGKSS